MVEAIAQSLFEFVIAPFDRYMTAAPGTVRAFGVHRPAAGAPGFDGETRMTGTTRSSSGLDPRRRRLLYRLWHRGTREMDLIMGRFADAAIGELTDAEIGELEQLAQVPDPELYAWLTGGRPVPANHDVAMFRRLRDFRDNVHHLRPTQ
jgi:antitoxin CptB